MHPRRSIKPKSHFFEEKMITYKLTSETCQIKQTLGQNNDNLQGLCYGKYLKLALVGSYLKMFLEAKIGISILSSHVSACSSG